MAGRLGNMAHSLVAGFVVAAANLSLTVRIQHVAVRIPDSRIHEMLEGRLARLLRGVGDA